MLGHNKRTTLLGILVLVSEALKLIIPLLSGGDPGLGADTLQNTAIGTALLLTADAKRA